MTILLYILLTLKSIFLIIQIITPMYILNSLVAKNLKLILVYILLQFVIFLIYEIISYFANVKFEKYLENRKIDCIDKLVDKITKQANEKISHREKYISWLINDMNILKREYYNASIRIYFFIFESIVFLLGLLYFGFAFFALNLIGTILITIYSSVKSKSYKNVNSEISKLAETKTKFITNLFENIFTFCFSRKMDIFKDKNVEYSEQYLKNMKGVIKPLYIFSAKKNILMVLIQTMNIILAVYYIYNGKITIGDFSVIGGFSGYLTNTFNEIIQKYISIKKSKKMFKRYDEELEIEKQGEINLSYIETIEFKDLSFKDIYNKFNYTFEKNKKYLIVGESGSGKSTLINLILKNLKEYTGEICINKHSLEDINKYSIYKNIEYINADNFIFYSNVADNISVFDSKIEKDRINKILDILNLKNRNEELSENSVSLGQKQRINLAKALYMDKPIIILDEATSNLDKENRERIEEMFLKLNKTLIFITHYYDEKFIKNFDEVLRLKRGGSYERHIISE